MADTDIRESFPILEDASGVGTPLTKTTAGDTATAKVGATVFAFKDNSGNVVLPQLDPAGRLPVTMVAQGVRLRAPATKVSGALLGGPTYTFVQVLSLPAASGVRYDDFKGSVNCRRGALFQLVYQDTVNSVILDEAMLDSGVYKESIGLGAGDEFVVPATASAPAFVIQAGNFDKASDLHASLSCLQYP